MSIINIIHISDLHVSSTEDPMFKRVRQEFVKDIRHLRSKYNYEFDTIVMSGDCVDRGKIVSYPFVKEVFLSYLKRLI